MKPLPGPVGAKASLRLGWIDALALSIPSESTNGSAPGLVGRKHSTKPLPQKSKRPYGKMFEGVVFHHVAHGCTLLEGETGWKRARAGGRIIELAFCRGSLPLPKTPLAKPNNLQGRFPSDLGARALYCSEHAHFGSSGRDPLRCEPDVCRSDEGHEESYDSAEDFNLPAHSRNLDTKVRVVVVVRNDYSGRASSQPCMLGRPWNAQLREERWVTCADDGLADSMVVGSASC